MGGKSRKSGKVSKALIQKLVKKKTGLVKNEKKSGFGVYEKVEKSRNNP